MRQLFKKSRRFYLILVSCLTLVLGSLAFSFYDDYFELSRNLQIFADAYREINLKYVDNVKPGDLIKKGLDAMFLSLDPYTVYIPQSEVEDFKMKYVNPQYAGIGAGVFHTNDKVIFSDIYEGFPAQKADIRAGDQLLKVDNNLVTTKNAQVVTDMLKGQRGTTATLLIARPGLSKPIQKSVVREEIRLKNVSYYGILKESRTGYIKLDRFLENSADEVKSALLFLKEKENISSLVLDLRGNGGGILQESVKIVNLFVDRGVVIVTQSGRNHQGEIIYKTINQPVDAHIPMVVLVDKGTASASEIVSGALQDLDRAVIVGQRSFGKGLVQQTLPLSYNTLMKVTIAKYYTPSGRCIQALDYGHRNKDGSVNQIADSSLGEFKTQAGRLVYDGSGIYPDLMTTTRTYSRLLYTLAAKQLIFNYATLYKRTHPSIAAAADFRLTDAEYAEFIHYLADKNYDYQTNTELLMAELKVQTKKEEYDDAVKTDLVALDSKIAHDKSLELDKYKQQIKAFLENEIAERYYFEKGRIICSLSKDADISKAENVLNNDGLYASILKGTGSYHVIGKPKMPTRSLHLSNTSGAQDSILYEEER